MFRRLHYLLPNAELAQGVVDELNKMGVSHKYIHTLANPKYSIDSLLPATKNQRHDKIKKIEDFFWNGNLLLFFSCLSIFAITIIYGYYLLALVCIAIMMISFSAGNFFIHHIPRVHLNQFKHALNHHELLLMVDVPNEKVLEIENNIHRHHPAAYEGGSTWTFKNVDI